MCVCTLSSHFPLDIFRSSRLHHVVQYDVHGVSYEPSYMSWHRPEKKATTNLVPLTLHALDKSTKITGCGWQNFNTTPLERAHHPPTCSGPTGTRMTRKKRDGPKTYFLFYVNTGCRGLQSPKWAQISMSQGGIIVIDHFWACWTLPTSSNMLYTTFIPTIVCLVWSLEASRGPKWVFSGRPQSILSRLVTPGPVFALPQYRGRCPPTLDQVWPLNSS